MSGRVRVGIVGTGFAASSHLDALARVPSVEVAGIAGSGPERAQEAAERFGVPRSFPSWTAMLEDDAIDAVHNCTPNHVHSEVSSAALSAGKHLLSEKPLAMDSEESARLVKEADAAGVTAGVCFNYRHFPLVRQLREELASDEHGAVHLVHGGYLQDWLLEPTDWNWRLEPEKGGTSRAISDIGSHWLDLVQHVTRDRVDAVLADLGTVHRERLRPRGEVETFTREGSAERERVAVATEDLGSVLLRFAGGARGSMVISQVSAGRKNRLFVEVDAARSAFAWDQEEPNRLWVGRRDGPNRDVPRDPGVLAPAAAALAHFPGGHQEGWPDALRNLFEEFYGTVRGEVKEPTFATFPDAHRMIRIVEAIVESHRTERWVRVKEETP